MNFLFVSTFVVGVFAFAGTALASDPTQTTFAMIPNVTIYEGKITRVTTYPAPYNYDGYEPIDHEREDRLAYWKEKQALKFDSLPKESFVINASAYTAASDECGKSDGVTASGVVVKEQQTLACPPNYPFDAKIKIEGMGVYTCEDRGGAIKGNHFDIYMKTKTEAFAFGRRNLVASVVQ